VQILSDRIRVRPEVTSRRIIAVDGQVLVFLDLIWRAVADASEATVRLTDTVTDEQHRFPLAHPAAATADILDRETREVIGRVRQLAQRFGPPS
jgi:hypothetical protein